MNMIFVFIFSLFSQAEIQPFKDEMFGPTATQSTSCNGAFRRLDYDELRDVNGRDKPLQAGQVALDTRVDTTLVTPQRTSLDIPYGNQSTLSTYQVGNPRNADFAVIFIHGGGGDRELGVSDVSFGGNFNRLQNLAVRNNGVYYSPTVTFDESGAAGVAALMERIRRNSPRAKIVVACASAGGSICRQLADRREYANLLSGIVMVGTAENLSSNNTPAHERRVPIVYAHGTRDKILSAGVIESNARSLATGSGYPVRYTAYNNGGHGTPIRMIDWRGTLNWIFNPTVTQCGSQLDDHPGTATAQ